MKVAIHQPNYLPWCGYFAKILACDCFIILDDAIMSNGRTFVSRTKVRTATDDRWLTVPTRVHNNPRIADVSFADDTWSKKHLAILSNVYSRSPEFDEVMEILRPLYQNAGTNLSLFNRTILEAVLTYLGIEKRIQLSSSLEVQTAGGARLIDLVQRVGGTHYISGRGGLNYQEPAKFEEASIKLDVREYVAIPYEAAGYAFRPGLSIVDALFILGKRARELLRYD